MTYYYVDGKHLITCCFQVRQGLMDLSQRILGPNTIVQGALQTILRDTPQHYYNSIIKTVKVSQPVQQLRKLYRTSINGFLKLLNALVHWYRQSISFTESSKMPSMHDCCRITQMCAMKPCQRLPASSQSCQRAPCT